MCWPHIITSKSLLLHIRSKRERMSRHWCSWKKRCVCVYMCGHVCYVFRVYMWLYMRVHVCLLWLCVYMSCFDIHMYISVCVYVLFRYTHVHFCACICLGSIYTCIFLCVYMSDIHMYISVCVYVWYTHVRFYMYTFPINSIVHMNASVESMMLKSLKLPWKQVFVLLQKHGQHNYMETLAGNLICSPLLIR